MRKRKVERGQILILTALMMTVLLGIAALSIDASFMYDTRNRLAVAADAAAKSAALEIHRRPAACDEGATLRNFGAHELGLLGIAPAGLVVVCPPVTGPFTGNRAYAEATVTQDTPTFFAVLLGVTHLTPGARAVAGTSQGDNCLIVFGALSIGNADITQPNCGVEIGGALLGGGGHSGITAKSISAASWNGNGAMVPTPIIPGIPPEDPLSGLPTPTIPGVCVAGAGASLMPGCYTTITANGMTLAAGLYIITGGLTMGNNQSLTGTGVTLYFGPTATVSLGQHDTLTLTAPSSGTYAGIAWFFDRGNTNPITVNNNTGLDITGAFYAKASAVDLGNHIGNAGDCALMVVGSLTINNGNGQLNNTCSGLGGSPILAITLAE